MKRVSYISILLIIAFGCAQKKELTLLEGVEEFEVSECRDNCSIDSVGIRRNEVKDGNLYVRFGYFLNCSWEDAFIKEIVERNDTMFIHVDRPHEVDTTFISKAVDSSFDTIEEVEIVAVYPITDCDCFFFFDLKINDVEKSPKVIRVAPEVDRDLFWDQSKRNKALKSRSRFHKGMSLDTLIKYVSRKDHHSDKGVITLYSKNYITQFFHDDSIVNSIKTERRTGN